MAEIVVAFEGPIGTGKSTEVEYIENAVDKFAKQLGMPITCKPDPARDNLYLDINLHGGPLEVEYLLARRARAHETLRTPGAVLYDRSAIAAWYVFYKNALAQGYIRPPYDTIYKQIFDEFMEEMIQVGDHRGIESLVINMTVPNAEILIERTERRTQERGEQPVPADYLRRNFERYGEYMERLPEIRRELGLSPVKILTIDSSQPLTEAYLEANAQQIIRKMKEMRTNG